MITNLYKAECDFLVREGIRLAKFEEKLDQMYGDGVIPHIENMG